MEKKQFKFKRVFFVGDNLTRWIFDIQNIFHGLGLSNMLVSCDHIYQAVSLAGMSSQTASLFIGHKADFLAEKNLVSHLHKINPGHYFICLCESPSSHNNLEYLHPQHLESRLNDFFVNSKKVLPAMPAPISRDLRSIISRTELVINEQERQALFESKQ